MGLMQTGKTVAPGGVEITGGVSYVSNDRYAAAGQKPPTDAQQPPTTFPEGSVRVGLIEHLDIGVGTYLGPGVAADGKYALFDRDKPYAIAARLGGGVTSTHDWDVKHAHAGVVASYDVLRELVPYAGATFTNHWISRNFVPDVQLAPGERFASHSGTGDGLLAFAFGVAIGSRYVAVLVEYDRWIPTQRDPGSGYRFVPSDVVLAGLRVCLSMCTGGAATPRLTERLYANRRPRLAFLFLCDFGVPVPFPSCTIWLRARPQASPPAHRPSSLVRRRRLRERCRGSHGRVPCPRKFGWLRRGRGVGGWRRRIG